jgi:adenine-specific DNA-methyltransferase
MASLQWIGKEAVVGHHREVPYHLLKGNPQLSVGPEGGVGSGNLMVQGDNLIALKALLPYYAGKVKYIYIEACRLGEPRLNRAGVAFRQIPYQIKVS